VTLEQMEARRAKWDRAFKKELAKFFKKQGEKIGTLKNQGSYTELNAAISTMLEADNQKLVSIYVKFYTDIVKEFGNLTYNELRSKKMFSIFTFGVYSWIASMALARAKKITSYSKLTVLNMVKKANEEGLTISQTAKIIKTVFLDSFSKKRSVRIARTEVNTASNYGSYMGAKQTGLKLKKIWISTSDSRTRPSHRKAGRLAPIDLDGKFKVGRGYLEYPGDQKGPVEEVVNCRCAIGYRRVKENGI